MSESENESLFADISTEATTEVSESNNLQAQNASNWFFADGIPGNGERPEFFDARYKTLADQAKAYKELEKKFALAEGAPEKYTFEEGYELPEEDQHIANLLNFAKESRIPNHVLEGIVKEFHHYVDQFAPDRDAEIAKLGENGKERVQATWNWAQNAFKDKPKFLDSIKSMATHAEVVEIFEDIMKMTQQNTSIPTGGQVGGNSSQQPKLTKEGFAAEVRSNFEQYLENPDYRHELAMKYERAGVFTDK